MVTSSYKVNEGDKLVISNKWLWMTDVTKAAYKQQKESEVDKGSFQG